MPNAASVNGVANGHICHSCSTFFLLHRLLLLEHLLVLVQLLLLPLTLLCRTTSACRGGTPVGPASDGTLGSLVLLALRRQPQAILDLQPVR